MASDADQLTVRTTAVEHHDAEADRFVRWYGEMAQSRFANAFAYGRHKVDVLLDHALKDLHEGAQILDVGCGTGEYVRRLNELGFQASGLEPAESMRKVAVEKNPSSTIVDAVATQLPFPDASFDFVICIEVLRYLHRSDGDQALREMRRVLKPGGKLFLTMVNKYALDGFFISYHVRKLLKGGISTTAPHCQFVTPAEVDQQLREAGFSSAVHRGVLFGPMRMLYKTSTRLARRLAPMLEPIDDAICSIPSTTRFAGHLVSIATR
jgi:ubiquinone/menaquinone biosynthesis C-methylase UbiE